MLVWGSWVVGFASALVVVLVNARDIPVREDFTMAPAMTGHQDNFLGWLWSQNNEHRVPLPRLVYLGLLKLWPDFRVGMVFNIVLLAVIAAAFIVFLSRVRGRTRWTDAFFPIVFLNLGNWENMGWGWELEFVVATALACGLLMGIASRGEFTTRRALVVGGCLVGIPLTGATALPFAPLLSLALIPRIRSASRHARVVLVTSITFTLVLTVVYFVGLQQPSWLVPSPSPLTSIKAGLMFLATGLGTGAGAWWLVSVLVVIGLLAGAAFVLYRARHRGGWLLLVFLLAGLLLAGEIGQSRAGYLPYFGLPDRYAVIAAPLLCCAYIAYERYGARTWRRLGPGLLCAAVVAALPLDVVYGLQFREWYHAEVDPFVHGVAAGVPRTELGWYRATYEGQEMWKGMSDLHQARIGIFSQLRVDDNVPPPPGRRIDGLDASGPGWSAAGGPVSTGTLEQRGGQPVLRWDYGAAVGTVPMLVRWFPAPESWSGDGSLAISFEGQGSGRVVYLRLVVASGAQGLDYWESSFVDSQAGSRTIVLPWNVFNHVGPRGQIDYQTPLTAHLQRVVGIVFGITEPGRGSLMIQRMSVGVGYPELTPPGWPEVYRHSLPPWPDTRPPWMSG
jgi:hypothetical protein